MTTDAAIAVMTGFYLMFSIITLSLSITIEWKYSPFDVWIIGTAVYLTLAIDRKSVV